MSMEVTLVKLGMGYQTAEINRRIRQTWAGTGKLLHVLLIRICQLI